MEPFAGEASKGGDSDHHVFAAPGLPSKVAARVSAAVAAVGAAALPRADDGGEGRLVVDAEPTEAAVAKDLGNGLKAQRRNVWQFADINLHLIPTHPLEPV